MTQNLDQQTNLTLASPPLRDQLIHASKKAKVLLILSSMDLSQAGRSSTHSYRSSNSIPSVLHCFGQLAALETLPMWIRTEAVAVHRAGVEALGRATEVLGQVGAPDTFGDHKRETCLSDLDQFIDDLDRFMSAMRSNTAQEGA